MNLQKALDLTDEMRPNMMERNTKILFLTEIEQLIYEEILMKHEHEEEIEKPEYDSDTDPGTELLVPDPYGTELYPYWLMSKIDLQNREMEMYNNDRALFENAYREFNDYWTREHMPLRVVQNYIF